MKNTKWLSLLLVASILLVCQSSTLAQSKKIVRKTITKVVRPEIAPVPPPAIMTPEVVPVLPPPPPPPSYEAEQLKGPAGLFGWGVNAAVGGSYLMNRVGQQGLLGLLTIRGDMVFEDPLMLGAKIGLAEDAVEYKLGVGLAFGNDLNNNPIKSIPFFADSVVYLKERSLFGLDPYVGAGLAFNLYGTGQRSGGIGLQLYGGILCDFGLGSGKTGIALGYGSLKVDPDRVAEGLFISVTQPLTL